MGDALQCGNLKALFAVRAIPKDSALRECLDAVPTEAIAAADDTSTTEITIVVADDSDDSAVTVSVGVCTDAGQDLAAALHCADSALYDAKGAGRNRVAVRSFLTPDSPGVTSPVAG